MTNGKDGWRATCGQASVEIDLPDIDSLELFSRQRDLDGAFVISTMQELHFLIIRERSRLD